MKALSAILGVVAILVAAAVLGFSKVNATAVGCGSALRPKSFSMAATNNTIDSGGDAFDPGLTANAMKSVACDHQIHNRRNDALAVVAVGVGLLDASIMAVRGAWPHRRLRRSRADQGTSGALSVPVGAIGAEATPRVGWSSLRHFGLGRREPPRSHSFARSRRVLMSRSIARRVQRSDTNDRITSAESMAARSVPRVGTQHGTRSHHDPHGRPVSGR